MIGDRQEHFEGKSTDLGALASHIEEYFKKDGFTAQSSAPSAQGPSFRRRRAAFSPA